MPSPQAEGSVVLWLHDFAPSARAWCRRMVLAIGLVGVTMSWANAQDFLYTVRQGDNPWNLTARYLLNLSYWPRLQRYNRIRIHRLLDRAARRRNA